MAFEPDDKWAYGTPADPDSEPDPGSAWPPPAERPPGRRPPLKRRGAHDIEANGNGSAPYQPTETGPFGNPASNGDLGQYGNPPPYGDPASNGDLGQYGNPPPYGDPTSTGDVGQYGAPPSYGDPTSTGDLGSYGAPPSYGDPTSTGDLGQYGAPPPYGDNGSHGQPGQYEDPGRPGASGNDFGHQPDHQDSPLFGGDDDASEEQWSQFNDRPLSFNSDEPLFRNTGPTDTTRLSTGRFSSPSLGAYDPAMPASADSGNRLQGEDDAYFDQYGYGKEYGDGNLGFEDDVDLEAEEAELSAMSAARRNGIEWAVVLVGAVLLALVLRAVLLQAFWIPSPSMESTLLVRDRVLVNKISYRLHDIHRGDVVVFRRTDAEIAANPTLPQDVIKRVIALEGEVIEIRDNTVFIDGGELLEPYLDEGIVTNDFGPEEVPAGHIFVMGDNRGLSSDSRFETGPVAHDRVVGRAFFLFWPLNRMGAL